MHLSTSVSSRLHRALAACAASCLLWLGATAAAHAAPATVTVENQTKVTRCAEEDNVSLLLRGGVRRFVVEALQPAYIERIAQDTTAPDFSGCNFDGGDHPTDPKHRFEPRTVTLHEDADWRIVGMTLPVFWRPQQVPVEVDGRRDRGFHMIQVFRRIDGQMKEALVMYPADGYWRIKPLPLARFNDGVYGSSMLLGPVRQEGRPVVNIRDIRIHTQPDVRFELSFAGGGAARIRLAEVSRERTALEVRFSRPVRGLQPFSVLRSMYVATDNADMSEVRWLGGATKATPEVQALPDFQRAVGVSDVRFGRSEPSRHNTSAPDIRYRAFER
ncbi:hypothetical protein [Pseudacidovorax sp. RU35E]|uniref:hypothetical protein n=1 Tax=Pseudacidovorax sp. RU35E TaxID=1907403 RepID=UPI000953CC14|nr:hypothetical protein [Pseudacidovorax sp. RU35E]SIP94854.1 hypothetical protein SAMN05880557_101248 [Pseudacidovorax sp. RU35E]